MQIDVSNSEQIAGQVPVVNGGTGLGTLTSGSLLTGAGTGNVTFTSLPLSVVNGGTGLSSPGASGNVPTSDGAGNWVSQAPTGGSSKTFSFFAG